MEILSVFAGLPAAIKLAFAAGHLHAVTGMLKASSWPVLRMARGARNGRAKGKHYG